MQMKQAPKQLDVCQNMKIILIFLYR